MVWSACPTYGHKRGNNHVFVVLGVFGLLRTKTCITTVLLPLASSGDAEIARRDTRVITCRCVFVLSSCLVACMVPGILVFWSISLICIFIIPRLLPTLIRVSLSLIVWDIPTFTQIMLRMLRFYTQLDNFKDHCQISLRLTIPFLENTHILQIVFTFRTNSKIMKGWFYEYLLLNLTVLTSFELMFKVLLKYCAQENDLVK